MNRILLLLLIAMPYAVLAQPAQVSQSILPTARITNAAEIQRMLDLMFIFEEDVTRLDVIDATNNGFGPDDIVVTYPSQRTYFLGTDVDREAQDIMDQWAFEAEFRRDASSQVAPEQFDPSRGAPVEADERAEMAILSDILYALRRNYNEEPVRLMFERSNGAFTFQMWDYEPQSMAFEDRPAGPPDTLVNYDLLYVIATDSLIEADTAYYDILYLQRTVQDSIFIPFDGAEPVTQGTSTSPGSAFTRQRKVNLGANQPR